MISPPSSLQDPAQPYLSGHTPPVFSTSPSPQPVPHLAAITTPPSSITLSHHYIVTRRLFPPRQRHHQHHRTIQAATPPTHTISTTAISTAIPPHLPQLPSHANHHLSPPTARVFVFVGHFSAQMWLCLVLQK
nr:hypothetical protein [Tanacetum cinerariifolium]